MDEVNAQAEADRVKFEKEQTKRVREAQAQSEKMGEHGVPESKRPI